MKQSKGFATKIVAVAVAFSMALSAGPMIKADAAKKKPKLNKTYISLEKGEKVTLKVKANGNKISAVTWKSSKPAVAKVSKKGVVTTKGKGSTTISASFKVKGAKKKTTLKCSIDVYEWETVENTEVTEYVQNSLDGVMKDLAGATYEPVALLAEQMTVGHQLRVLCKITEVVQNPKPYYGIVEITMTKKDDPVGFTVYADTKGIFDALSKDLAGGMVQTTDPMIPATAKPLIDSYVSANSIPYKPVAIVGTQVVSASVTNYLLACERVEPSGKMGYALVNLSFDMATLTPTIGDIFPFTFGKDYSVCTDLTADVVELAAAKIRNAVAKKDWETFSTFISFPIEIDSDNYADAKAFLEKVKSTDLNPDFFKNITGESCVDLFARDQGICMGDGEIWLNEVNGEIKITSLSSLLGAEFKG